MVLETTELAGIITIFVATVLFFIVIVRYSNRRFLSKIAEMRQELGELRQAVHKLGRQESRNRKALVSELESVKTGSDALVAKSPIENSAHKSKVAETVKTGKKTEH